MTTWPLYKLYTNCTYDKVRECNLT